MLVAQLCPTLCDPKDCSPPSFSVHGILQARTLEWVAMPSSRGSSQLREQTRVSCISGGFFTVWATREAPVVLVSLFNPYVLPPSLSVCLSVSLFDTHAILACSLCVEEARFSWSNFHTLGVAECISVVLLHSSPCPHTSPPPHTSLCPCISCKVIRNADPLPAQCIPVSPSYPRLIESARLAFCAFRAIAAQHLIPKQRLVIGFPILAFLHLSDIIRLWRVTYLHP